MNAGICAHPERTRSGTRSVFQETTKHIDQEESSGRKLWQGNATDQTEVKEKLRVLLMEEGEALT